jgi:hypothetical protein
MKFDGLKIHAVHAEGVNVAASLAVPIDKFDTQLKGALGVADEVVLVQAEQAVIGSDRRYGRFAHAHRSDFVGFDQRDRHTGMRDQARQGGGGHPSRRATTDNDDAADRPRNHGDGPNARTRAVSSSSRLVGKVWQANSA